MLLRLQALKPTGTNTDLIRRVQLCGHACDIPVAAFVTEIKKYEQHLSTKHGYGSSALGKRLACGARKVQWALKVEKALSKLEARIAPYLVSIDLLLHLESLEHNTASRDSSGRSLEYLKMLLSKVENLEACAADRVTTPDDMAQLLQMAQQLTLQSGQRQTETLLAVQTFQTSMNGLTSRVAGMETAMLNALNTLGPANALPQAHLSPAVIHATLCTGSIAPCWERPLPLNAGHQQRMSSHGIAVRNDHFLAALRKKIDELLLLLAYLLLPVQQIMRSFMAIAQSPTLLLQSNICLEDALGRTMSLPYEHFRYWPVLQHRLTCAFHGLPGEAKVRRSEYILMDSPVRGQRTLRMLNAASWGSSIVPGSKVLMSIFFERLELVEQACPRCQTAIGKHKQQEWVIW